MILGKVSVVDRGLSCGRRGQRAAFDAQWKDPEEFGVGVGQPEGSTI
jgi:hypothetical protein